MPRDFDPAAPAAGSGQRRTRKSPAVHKHEPDGYRGLWKITWFHDIQRRAHERSQPRDCACRSGYWIGDSCNLRASSNEYRRNPPLTACRLFVGGANAPSHSSSPHERKIERKPVDIGNLRGGLLLARRSTVRAHILGGRCGKHRLDRFCTSQTGG